MDWWQGPASTSPSGVVVVSATYNTRELIARLLWSLYRFAGNHLRNVVVVDNGSSDGSIELLQAFESARLCEAIYNHRNQHHGPALTRAISHVAEMHETSDARPWIWLLDSDCMVARDDTVSTMLELATTRRTGLLGEPHWDAWNDEQRVHGFSVLLDPAATWRPDIGPIPDGGDPIGEFERSCRQFGIAAHPFPFTQDGYVIHRGRATLAGVLERGEHNHPLFDWAKDHHEPHFQGVLGARERYDALVAEFDRAGGTDDISSLVSFCRRHVADTR